ncbi:MAG: leucine--tRNA ligase [candidate division Zixibacteria bacterium]|nr:leucine--tRNA ligase [Candidatus Tariuqbacter arcticus]
MSKYPFKEIEAKWRRIWEERECYKTDLNSSKPKLYCLVMFSYPSAQKLHIGHWYNYGPTDTWARFKRMQGYNVFEPMGFDAFGLPAENYAVQRGVHPAITTAESVDLIREQLKVIGAMYDWSRDVNTSSPDYYKWTQWLFLLLYKRGLAYQKKAPVNWCSDCQTVLANEQVLANGECQRCGTLVIKRDLKQWFFKITEYAEKLLEGYDKIDWPKKSVAQQSNWIGRSEGANIHFPLVGREGYIETFTTRADTLFGVTHLVLAPEHHLALELTSSEYIGGVEAYIESARQTSDIERESISREKTGVFTGAYVRNPLSGEEVPVWIADYVLSTYGTGAVMAVPGHDQRDFEFARKYRIPVKVVIQNPENSLEADKMTEAFTEYGTMVNSGEFNTLSSQDGIFYAADKLKSIGQGGPAVTYHLRDWLISRQRYWGAPIPIIHCPKCGAAPVPENDLPVLLPKGDIDFKPKGKSPLAVVDDFINTECPECGGPAKRDPDTMDTFVCSSWYYFRYLCAHLDDKPFDSEVVNRWLPVDQYVGGADHINGHLLYSRFITKALFDEGLIDFDEPFKCLRHQGMITNLGAKMSKSKGNAANPEVFIDRYGSDVFRLYLMFMGDYEIGGDWNDEGIVGIDRFVNRIWRLYYDLWPLPEGDGIIPQELNRTLHYTIKSMGEDIADFSFNTAISRSMELINAIYGYIGETPKSEWNNEFLRKCLKTIGLIIAPLAPHLGEELFSITNEAEGTVFDQKWPEYDAGALLRDVVEIAIQINGRLRGTAEVNRNCDDNEAFDAALNVQNIEKHLAGKNIVKKIFIKDKLLNIVAK